MTVLDFACGQGRIADFIKDYCSKLFCSDISEAAIAYCRNYFKDDIENGRIECVVNGKDTISICEESLDLVYSWDAMVHFEFAEVENSIQIFKNILKRNGFVFMHHSNYRYSFENKHLSKEIRKTQHWRSDTSKDDIRIIAERNGMEVIAQKVMDWGEYKDIDCITILRKR